MNSNQLTFAGHAIPEARDRIRRYCGLPGPDGARETWAYRFYDRVPTGPNDIIEPVDVVACAVLHPNLASADLAFFDGDGTVCLEAWLARLPSDVDLSDASEETVERICELPSLVGDVGLSLLSKVAHRKRPRLVPLFDRALVDRYRPITGIRGEAAWALTVLALRNDIAMPSNREILNEIRLELSILFAQNEGPDRPDGCVPTVLRLADIAIWMDGAVR